jgi:hypothetical protein
MVKSTHFRERHHATFRRRVDASWRGCVLFEGEMSSRRAVFTDILVFCARVLAAESARHNR